MEKFKERSEKVRHLALFAGYTVSGREGVGKHLTRCADERYRHDVHHGSSTKHWSVWDPFESLDACRECLKKFDNVQWTLFNLLQTGVLSVGKTGLGRNDISATIRFALTLTPTQLAEDIFYVTTRKRAIDSTS